MGISNSMHHWGNIFCYILCASPGSHYGIIKFRYISSKYSDPFTPRASSMLSSWRIFFLSIHKIYEDVPIFCVCEREAKNGGAQCAKRGGGNRS